MGDAESQGPKLKLDLAGIGKAVEVLNTVTLPALQAALREEVEHAVLLLHKEVDHIDSRVRHLLADQDGWTLTFSSTIRLTKEPPKD